MSARGVILPYPCCGEPYEGGDPEDHECDSPLVVTRCSACGADPAPGYAMVNDDRYCHPDDGPSCYAQDAQAAVRDLLSAAGATP